MLAAWSHGHFAVGGPPAENAAFCIFAPAAWRNAVPATGCVAALISLLMSRAWRARRWRRRPVAAGAELELAVGGPPAELADAKVPAPATRRRALPATGGFAARVANVLRRAGCDRRLR